MSISRQLTLVRRNGKPHISKHPRYGWRAVTVEHIVLRYRGPRYELAPVLKLNDHLARNFCRYLNTGSEL